MLHLLPDKDQFDFIDSAFLLILGAVSHSSQQDLIQCLVKFMSD